MFNRLPIVAIAITKESTVKITETMPTIFDFWSFWRRYLNPRNSPNGGRKKLIAYSDIWAAGDNEGGAGCTLVPQL